MVGTRRIKLVFWSEENNSSLSDTMRIGAFANNEKKNFEPELIIPNAPFSKLFIDKLSSSKHSATDSNTENDDDVTQNTKNKSKEDENKNDNNINNKTPSSPVESRTAALTMVSTNDDFIMKTPFASTNANSELGKFYREWQSAPQLQTFIDIPPLEELDVTKQLESFESDLNEYDTIVRSLCQSPNNN